MNPSKTLNTRALTKTRVALLLLCTGAIGASPLLAQDPMPPSSQQGPPPGGGGRRGGGMQQMQIEHLTKELNLTDDQVTKLKAIDADSRSQMMALRDDSSVAQDQKRPKMMAIRQAQEAKIKAMLTDDQKTKYDAMMAKMRERREEHRGDGAGGPPPPPPQ
jgi:protein CpxP